MLKQGWAIAENYKYSRSKIIVQDGKAYFTSDAKESMTLQGENIMGKTNEEATVELINGVPLNTKIVGHTRM